MIVYESKILYDMKDIVENDVAIDFDKVERIDLDSS